MDSHLPPPIPASSPVPPELPAGGAPGPQGVNPPTSGLAVASLVLGLVPCGFTGLAGIVCGVLAKSRIARSGGRLGGHGLATAGIVVSATFIFLAFPLAAILAGMLLPALAQAKGKAQQISCVNNLKNIGLAARMYAIDHDGRYPPGFPAMATALGSPKVLVCPNDSGHRPAGDWSRWQPQNSSYQYFGAAVTNEDPAIVLCYCTHHPSQRVNVLLADGSVQSIYSPRFNSEVTNENGHLLLLQP